MCPSYAASHVVQSRRCLSDELITQLFSRVLVFSSLQLHIQPEYFLTLQYYDTAEIRVRQWVLYHVLVSWRSLLHQYCLLLILASNTAAMPSETRAGEWGCSMGQHPGMRVLL